MYMTSLIQMLRIEWKYIDYNKVMALGAPVDRQLNLQLALKWYTAYLSKWRTPYCALYSVHVPYYRVGW